MKNFLARLLMITLVLAILFNAESIKTGCVNFYKGFSEALHADDKFHVRNLLPSAENIVSEVGKMARDVTESAAEKITEYVVDIRSEEAVTAADESSELVPVTLAYVIDGDTLICDFGDGLEKKSVSLALTRKKAYTGTRSATMSTARRARTSRRSSSRTHRRSGSNMTLKSRMIMAGNYAMYGSRTEWTYIPMKILHRIPLMRSS